SGHRVTSSDSGHWVTSIRSFGLSAGTASSGKALAPGPPGIGSSGSTAGIGFTSMTAGTGQTRHQVIWLPAGTASSGKAWAPGLRQRALSQLARQKKQRALIRYRIIWINSGHRVNWPNRIVGLDQLRRGIRPERGI
ncbi:unnamed protein product, partial [Staurois parvus]